MPPSILSRLLQCLKVWKERTTHHQVGFPLHQALWPATLVSFSLVAASQQDWQSCSTELTSTCCLNSSPLVLFKTLSLYSGLSMNLLLSGWLPSFSPASQLLWAAKTREIRPHVRMSFLKKNLGSKTLFSLSFLPMVLSSPLSRSWTACHGAFCWDKGIESLLQDLGLSGLHEDSAGEEVH